MRPAAVSSTPGFQSSKQWISFSNTLINNEFFVCRIRASCSSCSFLLASSRPVVNSAGIATATAVKEKKITKQAAFAAAATMIHPQIISFLKKGENCCNRPVLNEEEGDRNKKEKCNTFFLTI